MEKAQHFREFPISIEKSTLPLQESQILFSKHSYLSLVDKNRRFLEAQIGTNRDNIDHAFLNYLQHNTRVNGALNLGNPGASTLSSFLTNPIRLSRSRSHSRGYSYLVSRDTGLTAAEKLSILKEDVFEALSCIPTISTQIEAFVISDYLKNAMITMLNAMVSEEKIGVFYLDDAEYQEVRSEFVELASIATRFHYHFFFKDRPYVLPSDFDARAEHAISYLQGRSAKRWVRLHAASLSRPEASHPLVIFCASLNIALGHVNIQTVVGLPCGGTELALLLAMQYDFLYGHTPAVILLPLSLHSVKDIYAENRIADSAIISFLRQYESQLLSCRVLICDDNSSTGRTLQYAYDAIQPLVSTNEVMCAVAEIDIIRTLIDRCHTGRRYVANPAIFAHSINILPVSKRLRPKADIKELMENREIIQYHKRYRFQASNEVEALYREVMMDANTRNTTELLQNTPAESLIKSIQGTVLSNFYAIPIPFRGVTYPSVEHAYQHQKFVSTSLQDVDQNALDEIREVMRLRGYGAPIQDLATLFTDERFNAGNIKLVADVLRKNGYGKERWPEARVRTMIELLLIKFSDDRMKAALLATNGKVIIEGNDWEDTLWGYHNGRGRNLLGRILMNIRDRKMQQQRPRSA